MSLDGGKFYEMWHFKCALQWLSIKTLTPGYMWMLEISWPLSHLYTQMSFCTCELNFTWKTDVSLKSMRLLMHKKEWKNSKLLKRSIPASSITFMPWRRYDALTSTWKHSSLESGSAPLRNKNHTQSKGSRPGRKVTHCVTSSPVVTSGLFIPY